MILTEEELTLNEKALKNSARAGAMYATDYNLIEDIIDSHRELFKANASLSFINMTQTKTIETLKESVAGWARQYDELEEQSSVWREESGN